MIPRILLLPIILLMGIYNVYAADGTLPGEEGQIEHIERTVIATAVSTPLAALTVETRSEPPLIDILHTIPPLQRLILSYLDLETLLAVSAVSKDLYTLIETVFEHACDTRGFIPWPGKSNKLRFVGNLHYKRAFGLYPHEDRRVYYTRPAEPPYVPDMRLARKLVGAGFPKGAEILEVKAHIEKMRAIESATKRSTRYSAHMTSISSYSYLSRKFR
jgi:hypothetical protein